MALFPTLSTGSAYKYPLSRNVTQRAGVHVFCDFSETRYAKGPGPLTDFQLQYNRISKADKETLRSFYDSQTGEYGLGWQLLFESTFYKCCQFIGPFEATCVGPNLWTVTLKIRALPGGANADGSYAGGASVLPHGVPTSATLFITTSHILGTPYSAGGTCSINGLSFFSRGWMNDYSGWILRTDSTAVDPASVFSLDVLFAIIALSRPGVSNTTPDQFLIYDCWLNVGYADGTSGVMRPTGAALATGGLNNLGTLTNAQNAIDGNPTTCATISYPTIDYLSWSVALRLTNFV